MHAANGGVSYNDGTGRKFQNVKRFSVGQTIEIKVNTSTGIISWSVDG